MALYKIQASRVNNIEASEYTGSVVEEGQIWYDPVEGILRLYNGTQGGYIINSGGGGNSSAIINGNSNVVVYPNGAVTVSVNGVANVAVFEGPQAQFDNVVSTGNVTAQYFVGNGSLLTGIAASYTNANVADFLADFGANTITTTGNITANYFIGDGSQLTGIPESYANANVASFLADFGANTITTTGNITADYFVGNGSQLTGVSVSTIPAANVTGLAAVAVTGNYSDLSNLPTIPTRTSELTDDSGYITANIAGNFSATGNIVGEYFIGNGALLTGITATLPDQTGMSGRYLYTNGASPSWAEIPGVYGLVIDGGDAEYASTDFIVDGGSA